MSIEKLVSRGLMFDVDEHGRLITLQELLQHKLGRVVGYEEAVAYLETAQKEAFIIKFRQYAHTH